jgi:molybdopterin-guanine dinucleotide biosynthesis protein A
MGSDKAFLPFCGKPLVEHALAVMGRACPSVTIVGDPVKFSTYQSVVSDIFPGCGPLAGIHAGLKHSSSTWNLFLAVDMPLVSADMLEFLFRTAERADAVVVVPSTARGLQPLCAVYRRDFLPTAEDALRAGKYKIDAAFAGLSVRVIDEAELRTHGFSEKVFSNVNTPADLDRVERFAQLA